MHETPTDGKTTKPFLAIDKDMMDRDDLTIYDKVVYAVIKDAIGNNKVAWTSFLCLSKRCRLGRRTVQRSVDRLEAKGEIMVARAGQASGISNRYSIPKKRQSGQSSLARAALPGVGQSGAGVGQSGQDGLARVANKLDPSTNPLTNPEDPPTPQAGEYDIGLPSKEIMDAACAWSGRVAWGFISPKTRNRILAGVESHNEESVAEALLWGANPKPKAKSMTRVMTRAAKAEMNRDKEKSNGKTNATDAADPDAKFRALRQQ